MEEHKIISYDFINLEFNKTAYNVKLKYYYKVKVKKPV